MKRPRLQEVKGLAEVVKVHFGDTEDGAVDPAQASGSWSGESDGHESKNSPELPPVPAWSGVLGRVSQRRGR